MIGTHTDITFIKRIREANNQRKDFISNIIDNSNVIVSIIDTKWNNV